MLGRCYLVNAVLLQAFSDFAARLRALHDVDCFSGANLGVNAAEVYTSWLLSGPVGRCSVDSGL